MTSHCRYILTSPMNCAFWPNNKLTGLQAILLNQATKSITKAKKPILKISINSKFSGNVFQDGRCSLAKLANIEYIINVYLYYAREKVATLELKLARNSTLKITHQTREIKFMLPLVLLITGKNQKILLVVRYSQRILRER